MTINPYLPYLKPALTQIVSIATLREFYRWSDPDAESLFESRGRIYTPETYSIYRTIP